MHQKRYIVLFSITDAKYVELCYNVIIEVIFMLKYEQLSPEITEKIESDRANNTLPQ